MLVGTALAVCLTIGLAVGLSGGSSSSNSSDSAPTFSRGVNPIPNDEFELDAYLGTWHGAWVSRNQLRGTICQKGEYGLVEGRPDIIRVINSAEFANDAQGIVLSGYATASPDYFTVLQVNNGAAAPLPYTAPNYVIFGLGPKDQNGQYSWTSIASNDINTLYILVRDLDGFAENYEDEALAYVQSFGFPFEGASNDPGVVVPYPDPNACK